MSFIPKLIIFLFTLIEFSKMLNNEELLKPECDGKTIKYSISAKLDEYMDNENNIDGKDKYNSISDLYNKKIIIDKKMKLLIGNIFDNFKNLKEEELSSSYATLTNVANRLFSYKIDGFISYNSEAESFELFTNDLTIFPEKLFSVQLIFYINKNKVELKNELNSFISKNGGARSDLTSRWMYYGLDDTYLNLDELTGNKGTLKVAYRRDFYRLVYSIDGTHILGAEAEYIYLFAKEKGYKLEFIEKKDIEVLINDIKNGDADIGIGFLINKKEYENDIDFSNPFIEENINIIIRNDNIQESGKKKYFTTLEDFNGVSLGIEQGTIFDLITKNNFPKSNYIYYQIFNELLRDLFLRKIDGFLVDEIIADYYSKFTMIVNFATLPMNTAKSQNGFGFQKNEDGEKLKNEFIYLLKVLI